MKALPSGLMIFNNKDIPLQQKLIDCVQRFKNKFGVFPDVVWLHKETLGDYQAPDGLKLIINKYCQPNIFLVGPLSEAEAATGGSGEGV